jgi:hypothetical protein
METPLQEEPNLPRFNGVAIELVRRGLKGITPLVPPELDGLSLPIGDLLQGLDYVPSEVRGSNDSRHGELVCLLQTGEALEPVEA